MALLTKQISQLSTLAKFILKQHKTNKSASNLAPVAVNKIMALISESKICAYIQQGKDSLSKHQYVPAQKSFIMAQQMMLKIQNKNERIKQLENSESVLTHLQWQIDKLRHQVIELQMRQTISVGPKR